MLLFLFHGPRSSERWLLLAAICGIALFFLLQIAWNWQGGGGFVGNRYFVNVYPAFLFLVTRIRPLWTVPAGYALAGLFLGPLLFTPFGAGGPEPTLQAHVRNLPLRWLPLELTLRNVPGYHRVPLGDFRISGRRDQFLPLGEQMWVRGADTTEIYLISQEPLGKLVFQLRSPAPKNRVTIALGGVEQEVEPEGRRRPSDRAAAGRGHPGLEHDDRHAARLPHGRDLGNRQHPATGRASCRPSRAPTSPRTRRSRSRSSWAPS